MQENERLKLIELTERAVKINEKLLLDEKNFIEAVSADTDFTSLEKANDALSELSRKEYLYLSAAKSLLQNINKK